jgi:hypothetical protein
MGDLCRPDPRTRWEAVRALGDHAERTWVRSRERVEDLLRRLAWLLNDESGATGWGAPEAMGEILARAPDLQAAFSGYFVSWLDDENVFLDQETLDAGTIWSLGRFGHDADLPGERIARALRRFLREGTPATRGAAAWTAGRLGLAELAPELEQLTEAADSVTMLLDGEVATVPVGELAREALAALS